MEKTIERKIVVVDKTRETLFCELYDVTTFNDLKKIYTSVWGVEAYNLAGDVIVPNQNFDAILDFFINGIAIGGLSKDIYLRLAEYLRYTYGVTTSENIARKITVEMLSDVVSNWCGQLMILDGYLKDLNICKEIKLLWSQWLVYNSYLIKAKKLANIEQVDSYDATETMQYIHDEFEKADLLGLGTNFSLMRVSLDEILDLLQEDKYIEVLCFNCLAVLYGEGRFFKNLDFALTLVRDAGFADEFNHLRTLLVDAMQCGYRSPRKLDTVDVIEISSLLIKLGQQYSNLTINRIDLERKLLVFRQDRLRNAEYYLMDIERQYFDLYSGEIGLNGDPIELYQKAMNRLIDTVESESCTVSLLEDALYEVRSLLFKARKVSDNKYKHDYYYWTGFGGEIGQNKSRSLHQRVKLYYMEAYAERVYHSALCASEELRIQNDKSIKDLFESFMNFDERSLYIQEWIGNYGARRSHIFGFGKIETVSENEAVIDLDLWINNVRKELIGNGQPSELWGNLVTGYTEKLRFLLKPEGCFVGLGKMQIESMLRSRNYDAIYRLIDCINPYDHREFVDKEDKIPLITSGLHIHNVQPVVIFETMLHLRELDWNHRCRWTLLGTTTSNQSFAEKEYSFALDFGITRLGITNRQLLKGGNQNRIVPNIPKQKERETFYLTIDDDYVVSAQTLWRLSGILSSKPHAIFAQAPLFFRASFEPGHSIGRHCDSTMLLNWSSQVGPSFHESTTILPFGTGTLFRVSDWNNDIEMTGGLVVDPNRIMSGEDWAYGVTSMLMRFLPDKFETTKGLTSNEIIERQKRTGYYIAEDWIVGDGVDFAPGSQRQKARWNETCTRVFKSFWFPFVKKYKKIGNLDERTFTIVNYYTLASWILYLFYPFVFFIYPTTALFVQGSQSEDIHLRSLYTTIFAWGTFFLWFCIRTWLRRPVYRISGVPFSELFNANIMFTYGTFWSFCKTSYLTLFTKPERKWSANKGKTNTRPLLVFHLLLGLYFLFIASYSLLHGVYEYTWYFLLGFFFIYSVRFHEHAAKNSKEKVAKIARDVKVSFFDKISHYLAGQTHLLGAPLEVKSSVVTKTRIILYGEVVYFSIIVFAINYVDEQSVLSKAVMSAYLILIAYLVFKRFLIFLYSYKSISKQRADLGMANEVILTNKVSSLI